VARSWAKSAIYDCLVIYLCTYVRVSKVVHAIAHRNHYRPWMTGVAIAIPWIFGVCTYLLPSIATTRLRQGRCVRFSAWSNQVLKQVANILRQSKIVF